tara:strand:+ start:14 stop:751 length:738 start_codon:yes stop_codon:yes gene_type:complete
MNLRKNNLNLNIVYEDNALVVVNKQAGILTHSDNKKLEFSLVDLLLENNIVLSKGENTFRPGVVHRLDKETSGLIVFAKTDKAYNSLKKQFLLRRVEKFYQALVWGIPNPIAGTVNMPISSFLGKKKISYSEKAREAITLYETKKTYNGKFSLIECRILTGRTHQIRVHMLAKGCPVIGDKLYSKGRNLPINISKRIETSIVNFKYHALHATTISFYHPINNSLLKLKAKKPRDFLRLEQVLFEH